MPAHYAHGRRCTAFSSTTRRAVPAQIFFFPSAFFPFSLSLSLSFSVSPFFPFFFTLAFPPLLFLGSVPFRLFARLSHRSSIHLARLRLPLLMGYRGQTRPSRRKIIIVSDEELCRARSVRCLAEFLLCWRVAFCRRVGSSRGTTGLRGLIGCTMLHDECSRSLLGISGGVSGCISSLTRTS